MTTAKPPAAPPPPDLAAIRARLPRLASWGATALRWILRYARKNDGPWDSPELCHEDGCYPDEDDADFIAHAPTDIAALLAAVEALQARIAELEGQWARLERLLRAGWELSPSQIGPAAPRWHLQRDYSPMQSEFYAGDSIAEAVAAAPDVEREP